MRLFRHSFGAALLAVCGLAAAQPETQPDNQSNDRPGRPAFRERRPDARPDRAPEQRPEQGRQREQRRLELRIERDSGPDDQGPADRPAMRRGGPEGREGPRSMRFRDLSPEARQRIREWLREMPPEARDLLRERAGARRGGPRDGLDGPRSRREQGPPHDGGRGPIWADGRMGPGGPRGKAGQRWRDDSHTGPRDAAPRGNQRDNGGDRPPPPPRQGRQRGGDNQDGPAPRRDGGRRPPPPRQMDDRQGFDGPDGIPSDDSDFGPRERPGPRREARGDQDSLWETERFFGEDPGEWRNGPSDDAGRPEWDDDFAPPPLMDDDQRP